VGYSLIAHYEKYLGTIQGGWSRFDERRLPFQIVECRSERLRGISSFATLGFSKYALAMGSSGRTIRSELMMVAHTSFGSKNIPALMEQVGSEAIESGSAYLYGDVIGPRGQLFEDKAFEALYVTTPVCMPDRFAVLECQEGNDIVIAWLIPITHSEAHFVFKNGPDAFEDLLERSDPDLFDFNRASVC
jgi:hypothetical protein